MPSPPFTLQVLETGYPDEKRSARQSDAILLPATCRVEDDIIVPQSDTDFLERELLVNRLNDIHDFLWICGRPMPPRPLHHQRLLSRDIVICEDIDLHMVWWRNRIFLKPIPAYLLDPDFWRTHISITADPQNITAYRGNLDACARGFLFSYTALIAYRSDYRIAKECGLLPDSVTWESWKALAAQFLENHRYDRVNPRYWYGELRLSRLNKIYSFRKGFLFRGYSRVASHTVYGDLLRDNFSVLAGILGYVVVALSAMQVGLSVDKLQSNDAFQSTSYGLTVFSLIAPLIAAVLIFLFVLVMFISNWRATKAYEKRRFKAIGVDHF
ncbi:hypothetical protein ACHAPT_009045 [Fusarium lateritium]